MNDLLNNICPDQFALLAFVIALTLSDDLTAREITSLGHFIDAIGNTMLVIASQKELLEEV